MSRFRNAAPKLLSKELIISELPIKNTDIIYGNSIACNIDKIYFSLGGQDIGVLPLNDYGKKQQSIPLFNTLSNVSSIASTFLSSDIIATASDCDGLKIWKHNGQNINDYKLMHKFENESNCKVRNIAFHPTTPEIIAIISTAGFSLHDITNSHNSINFSKNSICSLSWKGDGSTVACFDESGDLNYFDPRVKDSIKVTPLGIKNGKVIWSGNSDNLLIFGQDKVVNTRVGYCYDVRKHCKFGAKRDLDMNTSVLLPIHDPDTKMIVVTSKGDTISYFLELEPSGLSPINPQRFDDVTHGICNIPRTCLDVMSCEVMKLIQLNRTSITPVSYRCTRKSYTSYYPELFPDADDNIPLLNSNKYFDNKNGILNKISLQPKDIIQNNNIDNNEESNSQENLIEENEKFNIPSFLTDTELYSKFRNIKGFKLHKDFQHDLTLNIDTKTSPESNGLAVYQDLLAIPLIGTSGKIGILKLSKPGRVADTGPFFVENKSPVSDFDIDKKNDSLLAAICDDAAINLWKIPTDEPLTTNLYQSNQRIAGTSERATTIKFHPCASDIISTSTIDGSINIWDINKSTCGNICKITSKQLILCHNWNENGSLLCANSADKKVYIFDPRSQQSPTLTANAFQGTGPGRLIFINDNLLLLSGFVSHGNRIIGLIDTRKYDDFLSKLELEMSPSVLIPHYDPDTHIAYMSGRGDSSIVPIEIRQDSVPLFELPRYVTTEPHSAFSLLLKNQCSVKDVEVAKVIRLLKSNTEIVSFNIARVRQEYFQDDLYPPTKKIWKASCSANDWFSKKDKPHELFDLQPPNMEKLSQANISPTNIKKYDSRQELRNIQKKQVQQTDNDFIGFVMGKAKLREDDPIIQDERQGIDDAEWND